MSVFYGQDHLQAVTAVDSIKNTYSSNLKFFNATSIFQSIENVHKYLGLYSLYGTHRNAVGIEGDLLGYTDTEILQRINIRKFRSLRESVGLSVTIDAIYYEKDFGIPEEKFTSEFNLSALYSVGEVNSLFVKYPLIIGNRIHNLKFGYTGYLTTDSTSQITGKLDYTFIKDKSVFMMNYENDTMLFYLTDKYRTAAFKMSYLYDIGTDIIGLSIGFNLWAGERNALWGILDDGSIGISEEVHRENVVTLYNAKEYSVDVVFLSLVFNNYSISFGYDSEIFKKVIHNNIHYILNDGYLPILDSADKFYIEFRIGLPDDLF